MNRFYLVILSIITITACRKDSSSFVNEPENPGSKCLVTELTSSDESNNAINTYSRDSILTKTEKTDDGDVLPVEYLHIENPKQFLYLHGSEMPESARTRIYLNADGNIDREIAVTLNADGQTYTEDADQVNHFIYNEKKQLIRADLNIEEESTINFSYDNKGRITRIGIEEDDEEFCVFDGFLYDDEPKKDNLIVLDMFGSLTNQFIPSLRNAYITRYKMSFPEDMGTDFPIDISGDTVFEYDYIFSKGKLTRIKTTLTWSGYSEVADQRVKLNCIN